MTRLLLLGLAVGLSGLVAPGVGRAATFSPPARDQAVVSGGIGLSRADWEAAHGPGDAAQNYVSYEGGAFYVQFRGDVVSYLEFGWDEPGVELATAEASVRELIPSDAQLVETFAAPPTAGGPTGLFMQRYESPTLAATPELGVGATGSILVVYIETPAPDRFEPNVARAGITVGDGA